MDESSNQPEPRATPLPIKTYSLEEVAAMALPPDMKDGRRWLTRRLNSGQIRGYKIGRTWRMTQSDVEELIAGQRNAVAPAPPPKEPEPDPYPGGLSRRSWLYRQRYGMVGNPNMQKPKKRRPPTEDAVTLAPKVMPAPSWFHKVHAETPEVIATLPDLTQEQHELLEHLRREGQVVVNGRKRKTVEALVRRGLATYQAEHVLNEKHLYYGYRFTLRNLGPSEGQSQHGPEA